MRETLFGALSRAWNLLPTMSAGISGGLGMFMTACPKRIWDWEEQHPRKFRIIGSVVFIVGVLGAVAGYRQQGQLVTKSDLAPLVTKADLLKAFGEQNKKSSRSESSEKATATIEWTSVGEIAGKPMITMMVSVSNGGRPTSLGHWYLLVRPVGGRVPIKMTPIVQTGNVIIGQFVLEPKDVLYNKTRDSIPEGATISGHLIFDYPGSSEELRTKGVEFNLHCEDMVLKKDIQAVQVFRTTPKKLENDLPYVPGTTMHQL